MIRYDTEISSFNDLCWQLTHFPFFAPTSVLRMRQMDRKHGFNGELRWRIATVDGPKGIRRVKFERTFRRLLHKFLPSRVCCASLLLIVWLLNRMQPFERNLTAKDSVWVLSKENPYLIAFSFLNQEMTGHEIWLKDYQVSTHTHCQVRPFFSGTGSMALVSVRARIVRSVCGANPGVVEKKGRYAGG